MISFVIFNATNMAEAWKNISGLFGANGESLINTYTIYYLKSYLIVLIVAVIGATPLLKNMILRLKKNEKINKALNVLEPFSIVVILLVVTAYLVDNSYNPFLYFRF